MTALILGLVLFLGMHSTRVFAEGWRGRVIAQRGENAWKGLYSVLSLVGMVLLCWGYGQARLTPTALWASPIWTRHLAATLMLAALVLMAAAYVPRNGLKARLHHPMVLSVKVWAIAHLLANNTVADLLLFGGFLVWSVLDFRSSRQRDQAKGTVYPAGTAAGTVGAVVVGVVLWAALAFGGHFWLFGVRPFG
jgi:uncharacterized membrane protein